MNSQPKEKTPADERLLSIAIKRLDNGLKYEEVNRREGLEDLHFIAGRQWDDDVKEIRGANRPCLTINRMPQFVRQLISDARMHKPSIKVHPIDDSADVKTAEVMNGLIRQIEMASQADVAYDTALEHAGSAGFGFFRIRTDYADDESFDQDIIIDRIRNNFSVTFDPGAEKYDKSDAEWCHVSMWMNIEEFEEKYPDFEPIDFKASRGSEFASWFEEDRVRLSEYFVKENDRKWIFLLDDNTVAKEVDGMTEERIEALGQTIKKKRKVNNYRVMRYLMNGREIIERNEFPGKYIPIVPVYGPELNIENETIYHSLIRFAKDPQRLYNYWQSAIAEKIALTPKSPYIVTSKQIAGHKSMWEGANTDNRPYLVFTPDPAAPGIPARAQPAAVNAAELQQSAQAIDDIKATTGMYDASLGARGNETSGRAIIARQREGDAATYTWLDNLARSISHAGRIILGLIPLVYDTARVVRVLGVDGTPDWVPINQEFEDKKGKTVKHNLGLGKYDLAVTVGPSYATQRIESQDVLMKFAQAVPQTGAVAPDILASMLDVQYADDLSRRLKKTVPAGLLGEQDFEEGEERPEAPADPGPSLEELSKAAKNAAETDKIAAEFRGQQLENARLRFELARDTGMMTPEIEQSIRDILNFAVVPIDQAQGMQQPGPGGPPSTPTGPMEPALQNMPPDVLNPPGSMPGAEARFMDDPGSLPTPFQGGQPGEV